METKRNPGPNSCYARALPDEPMFILLGRDPDAPFTIRNWARTRDARLLSSGEIPADDERQMQLAESDAQDFEAWRIENEGKWRDAKPSGAETPSEEMTSLAGKAINDKPLADAATWLRIHDELENLAPGAPSADDLRTAVVAVLGPYFTERESMAGSLLRLDPQAGQSGN